MKSKYKAVQQFDNLTVQLYRHLMNVLSSGIKDEITLSQLLIMRQIDNGIITVRDIAKELDITPAAISKLVEHLVRDGLVSKHQSEEDRRVSYLALTAKGQEIYDNNTIVRHNIFENILSCFNDHELNTFLDLINRIVDKLETMDKRSS